MDWQPLQDVTCLLVSVRLNPSSKWLWTGWNGLGKGTCYWVLVCCCVHETHTWVFCSLCSIHSEWGFYYTLQNVHDLLEPGWIVTWWKAFQCKGMLLLSSVLVRFFFLYPETTFFTALYMSVMAQLFQTVSGSSFTLEDRTMLAWCYTTMSITSVLYLHCNSGLIFPSPTWLDSLDIKIFSFKSTRRDPHAYHLLYVLLMSIGFD